MIIGKLTGGLGNQMFQYAAARRLALVHDTVLKLDLSFLKGYRPSETPREYELGHLNISADIATRSDVVRVTGMDDRAIRSTVASLFRKMGLLKPNPNVFQERHFHFDERLFAAPDNIYLDGYWQSEKYFKDIEGILREELSVRYPLEGKNLEIAEDIKHTPSVSVHIRRGDYISDSVSNQFHGVCGLDYYRACIELLSIKIYKPVFYIFSDEPQWAESNLNINFPTVYVKHNGASKGYEDLRLMSLCRHNIIANSSFSWWGAWLNTNQEKIVLAPAKWFGDPEINTNDLIPYNWKRL